MVRHSDRLYISDRNGRQYELPIAVRAIASGFKPISEASIGECVVWPQSRWQMKVDRRSHQMRVKTTIELYNPGPYTYGDTYRNKYGDTGKGFIIIQIKPDSIRDVPNYWNGYLLTLKRIF